MKRKRDPLYSNPVSQAVVRRKVMASLTRLKRDCELQAYMGSRVPEMVSDACMTLYAVAYAHMICRTNPKLRHKLAATSADARIMRGLAGALQDLANHPDQLELHRPAIQSGLAAIERVLPDLEPLAIGVGMVKCKAAIARNGISAADIQQMLGAPIEEERKAA